MSGLESADLQNSAGENSAIQNVQTARESVSLTYSEFLPVDKDLILRLSQDYCKQTIYDTFKQKDTTPLGQLTAVPPFPTPHVLAQFAYKTYTDYNKGETDAQYETRLDLPDGWKLLTTASNSSKTNGYFGAAYWHPEHQQVVIAHRGTANLGSWLSDLVGVVIHYSAPQMSSASTFSNKVVEVLQEVSRKNGVSFQLFFTGHSLGGWLAQVTTFTTKYLTRGENLFLKSYNNNDCYHPHTVVFDSPGCKDMLMKMIETFDVRLDARFIARDHLDITSYMSAPNLVNTHKPHVGTVYRIFPDLSDIDRWKPLPLWYTFATHSMEKIMLAFDPETGQVYTDDRGQLKVQVVVDWPNSASLKIKKEYSSFFKWADHLNNYHPDVQVVPIVHKSYNLIRYQTKRYDERVKTFSIFSEEEQEFLQGYRWLRALPQLFKHEKLLDVMKNDQAKEKAKKILESFEIEEDKISCKDASALQALIVYVKRMLQLFPEIKEDTKHDLLPDGVRKRVYQIETRSCVERISQSPMEFNSDPSSFREFLESEQQKVLNLRMIKEDEWTGLIKVHQVVQAAGCLIKPLHAKFNPISYLVERLGAQPKLHDNQIRAKFQYIVLKLERLLTVNQMMDLSKLMQSTVTPHLLLIACEDKEQLDEETDDVIRTLFNTIKQKPNIKIIFITRSGGSIDSFLHNLGRAIFGKGIVSRDEHLTWSDLTTNSKEKLLETSVKFQGTKISLNEIMSAASPVANFLHLGDLLEEKLSIADPVPISNAYNKAYYIRRKFSRQTTIKRDIFNDKDVRELRVFLATTEQEYKELCQRNPESNVHWLVKGESGKLVWQQSQGSMEILRRYICTDSSGTYTDDDLVKLLEGAKHQSVMIISDTAGMGKSTILTHLSEKIKENFRSKWVATIDLNDHTEALKTLKQEHIEKENVIEFMSEKLLKIETELGKKLFEQCCKQKQKLGIVIMLDGVDEICPLYKQTVIGLLQALRQTAVEQLWVTTRPHLRGELEDELQELAYTMETFSEEDQVEFLTKFWCLQNWFPKVGNCKEEEFRSKLETYAKHLIRKLSQSSSDIDTQVTGIPLQCRMLAESFDKEVQAFCQSAECVPKLHIKLDFLGLYEIFMNRKYDICVHEKGEFSTTKLIAEIVKKRIVEQIINDHQMLALKMFFDDKQLILLHIHSQCTCSDEELIKIGIVQIENGGKLHFIHRTFGEFYVAGYFVNELTKRSNISQQVKDVLLQKIFQEEEYLVIRAFIDGLLSRSNPSNEALKQYGNGIHDLGEDGELILHAASSEGNVNIIGFLLDSLEKAGLKDISVQLLLAKGHRTRTAWHLAALRSHLEVLHTLWELAEKVLTADDKKKLFLAAEDFGLTAWHIAADEGNLKVLNQLLEWAKQVLTQEELSNFFLARDGLGRTAWHLAAGRGHLVVLNTLWEMAKEVLTQEELNKLFLVQDNDGMTAWHVAAEGGHLVVLHTLWQLGKQVLTQEELNKELFLVRGKFGRTTWHEAALRGHLQLLHTLWELAEKILRAEEIKKLFLAPDGFGLTAWHIAADEGNLKVLNQLLEWAKQVLTQEELNKLFLARDGFGRTAWHLAAEGVHLQILHPLWELAKQVLTQEQLNKDLFLGQVDDGMTVWHVAARRGHLVILETLWEMAKEVLTEEELINLFLVQDNDRKTAWHVAAMEGHLDILPTLWEWAKELLTPEEINYNLFLDRDNDEWAAWNAAAERDDQEVLNKLLEWAKEVLTAGEINNMALPGGDC